MSDPRFVRLRVDPRFRKLGKRKSKIVVDERFKSVFDDDGKDSKKSGGRRVDKYGRRITSNQQRDNLQRFYRREQEGEKGDEPPKAPDYARGEALLESSDEDEEEDSLQSDDGVVVLGRQLRKPVVPNDRDASPEVDLNEDAPVDLDNTELNSSGAQNDAERTKRIACVNLDWDHVKATHLYKIASSLVSPTAPSKFSPSDSEPPKRKGLRVLSSKVAVIRGRVLNVRVYPSDFGRDKMAKEETDGPPKELFKKSLRGVLDENEEEITEDILLQQEDSEDENEALRKYQLERLRYYYAIITCDTVEAASHIYDELDGTELERTGNILDLSFVPDDMIFEQQFRDEATPESESVGMQPSTLDFSTAALRHSKVKLTWDDDDPERNKLTRRALSRKDMLEGDFRALLAPSSGSEQSDDDDDPSRPSRSKRKYDQSARERSRALLLGGGDADPFHRGSGDADPFLSDENAQGDLEITFTRGLTDIDKAGNGEETTLDKYKQKKREKRLQRLNEKKARREGQADDKADVKKAPLNDDFFGNDTDEDHAQEKPRVRSEKKPQGHTVAFALPEPSDAEDSPSVALDPRSGLTEPRHFGMPAILKAEKIKGKKKHRSKKTPIDTEGADLLQEDFQIDVKDERFEALHKDHTFAIDPTNPQFKNTSSMSALFDEQAKRRKFPNGHEGEEHTTASAAKGDRALQTLVQSVKRQSGAANQQGGGKRRKT